MKLKNVQAYEINDVPDHITHECSQLGISLVLEVEHLFKGKDPNIILGAITFFHAAMIKNFISDKIEEQEKAAKLSAMALIKNVGFLNTLK
jgi:hypothetical protein